MGQESLEKGKELVELHSKPLQEGHSRALQNFKLDFLLGGWVWIR